MKTDLKFRPGLLLAVTFGLAAVAAFIILALIPQLKAYAGLKEELALKKADLSRAKATAASLPNERELYSRVNEEYGVKGQIFATEMRDGSAVVLLGFLAAAHNIEITGVDPGPLSENNHTLEMPLKIEARGDFLDLIDFFQELEDLAADSTDLNLAEIRRIKLETPTESKFSRVPATPGLVEAEFDLVLFSAREPRGKLQLEELTRWDEGRQNIFNPIEFIVPVADVEGLTQNPANEGNEAKID